MKPLSEATICVVDHGLFTHIAQCLATQAGHVFYTGPSERVMRLFEDDVIGDGLDNITRVESLWQVDQLCDAFVFPDTGFGWEQRKLLHEGKAVFGHHGADVLEANKGQFLKTLGELELEVPPYQTVQGMDELMDLLKGQEDKYVKVSKWRGDWETFHFRNWDIDGDYLRGHKYNRCPARDKFTFYVFDAIEATVEDGIDTWCIDGDWPKNVLHAMERKDKALVGAMQPMTEISPDVSGVNDVFGPYLGQRYGYRGPFSTEVRIGDKSYFIDPTLRFGSPPSQLQTELIKNLPEVIYRGAHGELVEPEWDDAFGAQVLITTDRDKEEWLSIPLEPELREHVKSSFCCEIDGEIRIAPNPLEHWAGWLVATGKSLPDVIDTLKERCEMLPDGFDCDITCLAHLLTELEDAKEEGIEMTDQQIPEPEIVL